MVTIGIFSVLPGLTSHRLIALNAVSLALALVANLLLLSNFAHRVRYSIAQPLTIVLW